MGVGLAVTWLAMSGTSILGSGTKSMFWFQYSVSINNITAWPERFKTGICKISFPQEWKYIALRFAKA
jgi:hypothetical protein